MTKVSRWILGIGIALAALTAGMFTRLWVQEPVTAADAAQVLMATSLLDVNGHLQPLEQWKGKVLVVNFWATWCPPCLKEIPEFVRMQAEYGDRGVQFVGIAIDDKQKVAKFAAQLAINYPLLIAETEGITLARQAGNRLGGLPFTVIIDRRGNTAKIELGTLDEKKLAPILKALL